MSKEKGLYNPKKLLATLNKEKSKAKLKVKKIRSSCPHQGKNGKYWIRPLKDREGVCKCQECRQKIDLNVMAGKSSDEVKEAIKACGKELINWIDIAKIQMSPKNDADELKYLGDTQYAIHRVIRLMKAYVGESFEVHKKKKNKKKGKKKNKIRIRTGGKSLGFGK
jgi:hypothetical protein